MASERRREDVFCDDVMGSSVARLESVRYTALLW